MRATNATFNITTRISGGLIIVALVGTPGSSSGAASKVCHLVTDARGDVATSPARADDPALDLLGADLATTDESVLVAFRVRGLVARPSIFPGGPTWAVQLSMEFQSGPWIYFVSFRRSSDGDSGSATAANPRDSSQGPRTAEGIATVDERRGYVTLAFDRKKLLGSDTNVTLTGLLVRSRTTVDVVNSADEATSTATYRDRTPSCLSP